MRISALILGLLFLFSCREESEPIVTKPKPEYSGTGEIYGLELAYRKTSLGEFTSICFTDVSTGFVGCRSGAIYKTTDRGFNWEKQETKAEGEVNDIFFLNKDEGFAVVGNSLIHTDNGGAVWTEIKLPLVENTFLKSVCFVNKLVGFVVGSATIFSTTNGGISWETRTFPNIAGGYMKDVEFANEKVGLVVDTYGRHFLTKDGGKNWSVSTPNEGGWSVSISVVNENVFYFGGKGGVCKTIDQGSTWTIFPEGPKEVTSVVFKSEKNGFAFGSGVYSGGDWGHTYGAIYYTTSGGKYWKGNRRLTNAYPFLDASFPTDNTGYAICGNMVVEVVLLRP